MLSCWPAQIYHCPADYVDSGMTVASDERAFGEIDYAVAAIMQHTSIVADYPGNDFYAYVWCKDGLFHGEVWVDHECKAFLHADGIGALVRLIRSTCGSDAKPVVQ